MTDINVIKNVESEFNVSIPSEFEINDGYAAKFNALFGITFSPPDYTKFSDMNLAMASSIVFDAPDIVVTGPTSISKDSATTDCFIKTSGLFSALNYLPMGSQDIYGHSYKDWIPFTSVSIAQGTTLSSAILSLTAYETNGTRWTNLKIGCDYRANAVVPTTKDDLNSRSMGTYITYSSKSWTLNTVYTFNVLAPIQEIINLSSWVSGNDLAILIFNNGSTVESNKVAYAADFGSHKPHLDITYT